MRPGFSLFWPLASPAFFLFTLIPYSLFSQHPANCSATSGDVNLPCGACQRLCFRPLHRHPALPILPCHPQHCHHSQPAFFLFPLTLPPVEQEQPRPRACSPACRVLYKICLVLLCFPFLLPWPAAFTRSLAASFCCPPVAAPLATTRPAATSPLPPGVSA